MNMSHKWKQHTSRILKLYGLVLLCLWTQSTIAQQEIDPLRPFIKAPLSAVIPDIDGRRNTGEWDDAAQITGFVRHTGKGLFPSRSTVFLKYDKEFLYIMTESERLNDKPLKITRQNDAEIFLDDSIELHITPDGKRLFQLIGNAAGYTMCNSVTRGAPAKWKCSAMYAASIEKDVWIGEWAVPMSDITSVSKVAVPQLGTIWRFNIADNHTTLGLPVHTWAGRSELANPGYNWEGWQRWSYLEFGDKQTARLDQLEQPSSTQVRLRALSVGCAGEMVVVASQNGRTIAEKRVPISEKKTKDVIMNIREIGSTEVIVSLFSNDKELLLRQVIADLVVTGSLGLEVLTDPFNRRLLVKANSDHTNACSLVATVSDWAGKTLLELPLKSHMDTARSAVDDPAFVGFVSSKTKKETLPTGKTEYRAEVEFDSFAVNGGLDVQVKRIDASGTILATENRRLKTFAKPDWFANPLGMERDSVPEPWHPLILWHDDVWIDSTGKRLEVTGSPVTNHISTAQDLTAPHADRKGPVTRAWGREFAWGSQPGVMIDTISSLGRPLLADPMRLKGKVNKKPLVWEHVSEDTRFDGIDFVRTVTWQAGELRAEISSKLEYDGFIWFDMILSADKPYTVDMLQIELPIRSEVAELFNYRSLTLWPNSCTVGAVPKTGTMPIPFTGGLALSNDDIGIGWINSSMKGWKPTDPENPMSLTMQETASTLRVHLADSPVIINGEWRIQFGLQATPIKPWNPDFAFLKIYEPVGYSWLTRTEFLEQPAAKGVKVVSFHEHWSSHQDNGVPYDEKGLKELVKVLHERGIKIILYSGFGLSEKLPAFDFFRWPWIGETLPSSCYVRTHNNYMERAYTTTKSSQAHWADFMVSEIARWIDDYDIDGVFIDGMFILETSDRSYAGRSFDPEPDSARRDWLPLDARRYAERVYRVVKSRKPNAIINLSKGPEFCLYSGGFATHTSTGESLAITLKANNTTAMGNEHIRAVYGKQYGVPADVWGYNFALQGVMNTDQLSSMGYLHGVPLRAAGGMWFLNAVYPFWQQSEFLKHGEFIGYWNKKCPVKTDASANAHASVYRLGDRMLVVVAHSDKNDSEVEISCKLGERKWTDVRTKKILAQSDATLRIMIPKEKASIFLLELPTE